VTRLSEGVRAGRGPAFIEAITYRFRGHSMADPSSTARRAKSTAGATWTRSQLHAHGSGRKIDQGAWMSCSGKPRRWQTGGGFRRRNLPTLPH
jgi:hypothetical protein